MRRMNAVFEGVSPIVAAFLCGNKLPDLAWAIDTNAGIHSFTDLYTSKSGAHRRMPASTTAS